MVNIIKPGFQTECEPGSEILPDHQSEEVLEEEACHTPSRLECSSPLSGQHTERELQDHRFEVKPQSGEVQQLHGAPSESKVHHNNQTPTGYFTLNEHGLIMEANFGASILLGVSPSALVGRALSSFVVDMDSDGILLRQTLVNSSEAKTCVLRLSGSAGTQFWAHLAIIAEQGAKGSRCNRVVLSDIEKQIEAKGSLPTNKRHSEYSKSNNIENFSQAILESVSSQIAVLDQNGTIISINAAWRRFPEDNGMNPEQAARHTGIGVNYLDACKSDLNYTEASALTAREGIIRVLDGTLPTFFLEYACHSPHQQRWFIMSVTKLDKKYGGVVVAHTDITDAKEKLRALATHQEQLLEQERKHIAMEVHDEMGQFLTVLGLNTSLMSLRFGNNPELLAMIEGMRSHVDNATKVVRRIASNLRPAALDLGLLAALEWLAEDFSRHCSIGCKLDATNLEVVLDELRSTAVFRVVQESLTNVARHANAKEVVIVIRQNKQQLQVIVKDDGQGFDAEAARHGVGFGLFGMRERLLALGGSLHIASTPGKGTAVSIELPRNSK